LLLAYYLSTQINKTPNFKTLLTGASIVLFPGVLVMLQPDTGSALAFFALIFVFYREGYLSTGFLIFSGMAILLFIWALIVNQWLLIRALSAICGTLAFLMRKRRKNMINMLILFLASSIYVLSVDFAYEKVLQSHQRNRIDVILGKVDDPRGQGYNLNQSMIAIGSGQLLGKGY